MTKLKAWRRRQKSPSGAKYMTQDELGDELGVTRMSINRYENGRMPTRKVLRAIYKLTSGEVTANDFQSYEDDDAS